MFRYLALKSRVCCVSCRILLAEIWESSCLYSLYLEIFWELLSWDPCVWSKTLAVLGFHITQYFFFSCICKKSLYKQCSAVSKRCKVFPFASCFCSVFVKRPCPLCTGVSVNVNAFSISYCVFQHAGTWVSLQQALLPFIYGKTRLKRSVHVKVKAQTVLNYAVMSLLFPLPLSMQAS